MPWTIEGKTVLITGGNTGIGKATAIDLAKKGARVVISSRDEARGAEALADIKRESGSDDVAVMPLDLGSFASIRAFAAQYLANYDRLDVLIENAGVSIVRSRQETHDGLELTFGVNHIGHFLLTDLLMDRLKASAPARVIVLSSGAFNMAKDGLDWSDLQHEQTYHGFNVYGHSKLANIYFTRELARRLEGTGITVNAVHPGYVDTQLGRPRPEDIERFKARAAAAAAAAPPSPSSAPAAPASAAPKAGNSAPNLSHMTPLTPHEGAFTSIYLATSPEVEGVTGAYFAEGVRTDLPPHAADMEAAGRLWNESEAIVAGIPA